METIPENINHRVHKAFKASDIEGILDQGGHTKGGDETRTSEEGSRVWAERLLGPQVPHNLGGDWNSVTNVAPFQRLFCKAHVEFSRTTDDVSPPTNS